MSDLREVSKRHGGAGWKDDGRGDDLLHRLELASGSQARPAAPHADMARGCREVAGRELSGERAVVDPETTNLRVVELDEDLLPWVAEDLDFGHGADAEDLSLHSTLIVGNPRKSAVGRFLQTLSLTTCVSLE